ncbi:hypothetical protein HJG60_010710 [Phyllostomus discolor]|uniref:Uncharacterized protein n=1 Tax=Phyllostomus discolor TaxID=89673 RepID=A0A834ALU4_9CHIR|nr:hypothetical protein HJG60_010710 [Phyllostomus discolor]
MSPDYDPTRDPVPTAAGPTHLARSAHSDRPTPAFRPGNCPWRGDPLPRSLPAPNSSVCWKRATRRFLKPGAYLGHHSQKPRSARTDLSPVSISRGQNLNLSQERPSLFTHSQETLRVMKKCVNHPLYQRLAHSNAHQDQDLAGVTYK